MLLGWFTAGLAAAAPYGSLVPAVTVAGQATEMGGAVSVGSGDLGRLSSGASGLTSEYLRDTPAAGILFGAWARYGLTDRIEAVGGVWLPVHPLSVGAHGGARVRLLGDPTRPGGRLTIGASAGSFLLAPIETLSLTVPVAAGVRVGDTELWLAPSVTATQQHLGVGGELGLCVLADGIPVLFGVQATDWGEAGAVLSGGVGVAFSGGM